MKAALLLLLTACSSPPPPLPAIELFGERLLLPTGRWYDPERQPVLRAASPLPPNATFAFGDHVLRITRQEMRAGAQLTWLAFDPPPPYGPGELRLMVKGETRQTWPIEWMDKIPKENEHFALVEQARALQRSGQPKAAAATWEKAAASAQGRDWPGEAARCLRAAAFCAMAAHDLVGVERLLAAAEALPSGPWGAARLALQRGHLAQRLGEFTDATEHFRSAMAISFAAGEDVDHAAAAMTLGTLLVKQGRHAEARALIEQSRPFFEPPRARPAEQATWLANLGFALMSDTSTDQAANLAEAQHVFKQARALYETAGEKERVAFCEVKLAYIAWREGRPEAAAHVAEARRLAPGGVEFQEGPLLLLEATLNRDLRFPPSAGLPTLAFGEVPTGDTRASLGETRPFGTALDQAQALAEDTGDRDLLWQVWHTRGRLDTDRTKARVALLKAIEILDDLGRRTSVVDSRGTFFADRTAPVEDALHLLLEEGATPEAFAIADEMNARVARSLEGQGRVGRLSPAARLRYAELLGTWLAARQAHEADGQGDRRRAGAALETWRKERAQARAALDAQFEALQRFLDAEAPVTLPSGGTVTALQALLEPDAALLLFARARRDWIAFLVDARGLQARAIQADDPLASWRGTLEGYRRLYVVPGGLPSARSIHKSTTIPVGYLPYAGVLRPPGRGEGVLIIADPTSDLPHARAEGEALARQLPGSHLLVGEAARREAVLAALPRARWIHFAGHGALDPTSPWDAHLSLAVGSSRVDLQACKLEYSIVSPK